MSVANGVLETIGNTPLVRLTHIPSGEGSRADVLVKMESFNPSGSLKDRIYKEMIGRAAKRGDLRDGMGDPRGLDWERRHSVLLRGPGNGVPRDNRPPQRDERGEEEDDRRLRRKPHPHSRRRVRRRPLPREGRGAPRQGAGTILVPQPVCEQGQPRGPLQDHRSRDSGARPAGGSTRSSPPKVREVR